MNKVKKLYNYIKNSWVICIVTLLLAVGFGKIYLCLNDSNNKWTQTMAVAALVISVTCVFCSIVLIVKSFNNKKKRRGKKLFPYNFNYQDELAIYNSIGKKGKKKDKKSRCYSF